MLLSSRSPARTTFSLKKSILGNRFFLIFVARLLTAPMSNGKVSRPTSPSTKGYNKTLSAIRFARSAHVGPGSIDLDGS